MRIAVIGGGPGGLYFALLAKQLGPEHEITVWERNAPDDTFGFGVVFSDETLGGIEHADAAVHRAMEREFARWDDIDIQFRPDPAVPATVITSGGHGFAAMSRRRLLAILQDRCRELGVRARTSAPTAPDPDELAGTHDLVVAADGVNSTIRAKYADRFRPTVDTRQCRYMWLGTDRVFDAFTFDVRRDPVRRDAGACLPVRRDRVDLHRGDARRRCGGGPASPPAPSPPGRATRSRSRWSPSCSRTCSTGTGCSRTTPAGSASARSAATSWRAGNVVLLGDAAHTAHFSIGSGTKLAMEDALALAASLHEQSDCGRRRWPAYDAERRPVVVSTQRAAQASLEWFENLGRYVHQEPAQFAFNLLTRSRRVTLDNLRLRDPEFVSWVEGRFTAASGAAVARARRRCSTRSGCAAWSCATG